MRESPIRDIHVVTRERHVERHCDEQDTHRGLYRANEREKEERNI